MVLSGGIVARSLHWGPVLVQTQKAVAYFRKVPMRHLPTVLLLFCLCTSLTAAVTTAVNGVWEGKIQIDGEEYRIVLHLGAQANGSSVATLDTPDIGKLGIPLPLLESGERSVAFELNDPKVSFKGCLLYTSRCV